MPACAAHEQHADGRDIDDRHAIVTRAGWQVNAPGNLRLRLPAAICCCSSAEHGAVFASHSGPIRQCHLAAQCERFEPLRAESR